MKRDPAGQPAPAMWRLPESFRSLLAQSLLWIVLPLTLAMLVIGVGGVFAYQQVVTSLLVDRDRQLAIISATRVSEAVEGYARVLETLASDVAMLSSDAEVRAVAIENASEALEIFNAGVMVTDREGWIITTVPRGPAPEGETVAGRDYFLLVHDRLAPEFSNVLTDARTGEDLIIVAVPILNEANQFGGALLGAVSLNNTPLDRTVRGLIGGDESFAYLVDGHGRIIFHPEQENSGADFTNRPFVRQVIAGERGGTLWKSETGELLVIGYAPVEAAGWGLIIPEPWASVAVPAQVYGLAVALAGVGITLVTAYVVSRGVRRITKPVRLLATQTARLAAGESVETLAGSDILEIDKLERAFNQTAEQITSYRAGLRRYVGAITKSQEDERRRIARDLHDDTVQSLLAVIRRLEASRARVARGGVVDVIQLLDLQTIVGDILRGVREISQDLRPPILEDLGLIPALEALLQTLRNSYGEKPATQFNAIGPEAKLDAEQELALYRITQESLTNAYKHAQASQVLVELTFSTTTVRLVVQDDGIGFQAPPALTDFARGGCFGLLGIQERVWAVGGWLSLLSTPGQGTQLSVTIPK